MTRLTEEERQELRREMTREGYEIGPVDQTWGKLGEALFSYLSTDSSIREIRLERTGDFAYEAFLLHKPYMTPEINNCQYGGTLVGPVALQNFDSPNLVREMRETGLPETIRVIQGDDSVRTFVVLFGKRRR